MLGAYCGFSSPEEQQITLHEWKGQYACMSGPLAHFGERYEDTKAGSTIISNRTLPQAYQSFRRYQAGIIYTHQIPSLIRHLGAAGVPHSRERLP